MRDPSSGHGAHSARRLVGQLLVVALCLFCAATSPTPVTTRRRHLLVDDSQLESIAGATFTMNPPYREPVPVLTPESGWENASGCDMTLNVFHSAHRDPTTGTTRLWLDVVGGNRSSTPGGRFVGFAESRDGLTFTKPALGQVATPGCSSSNSLLSQLSGHEGTGVWEDPLRSLGGRLVSQAPTPTSGDSAVEFAVSDNGINWTAPNGAASSMSCHPTTCDTQTNVFYDPWKKEYAMYTREWVQALPHHWHYRTVRRLRCDTDKLSQMAWNGSTIVMRPDAEDANKAGAPQNAESSVPGMDMDYYGAVVWPYLDSATPLYFMLMQRTWHWGSDAIPSGAAKMAGPAMIDVGLAVSRDGLSFAHVGGRESFLHGGAPGSFDSKFQWLMPNPVVRDDFALPEIWYYYGGLNRDHAGVVDGGVLRGGVGLARGRLDGLVSLDAPLHSASHPNGSTVVTRPLQATGGELLLNVDTGAQGAVWVEVLEAESTAALPGFGRQNAVAIVANDASHAVRWVDKATKSIYSARKVGRRAVKLRMTLVGAKLFSYGFEDA